MVVVLALLIWYDEEEQEVDGQENIYDRQS